jgi:hypothetical protein
VEASFIESGRWVRGDDDVALRLRVGNPHETLAGGVAVEPRVVALVFEGRDTREQLPPGDYSLPTLLKRPSWAAGREIDLALVDTKSLGLPFSLKEVAGKYGGTASLSFVVTLEIASAPKLVSALLPSPGRIGRAELAARLHADVRAAADATLGRESLDAELDAARVGAMLEAALTSVGAGCGLRITRVADVSAELDASALATQYGEVDLQRNEGGAALELAVRGRTSAGSARAPALGGELEGLGEAEGISPEALIEGRGPASLEGRATPPRLPESELVEEKTHCPNCGVPARAGLRHCPACATPLR